MRKILLLLCLLLLSPCARADDGMTVKAKLVAENESLVRGDHNRIGIYLTVPKGWHIYGQAAGDVGLPTSVEFHVPEKFMVGKIAWPLEEGFTFQGINSHGYSGKVLLPANLTVPQNAKLGERTNLAAHVEWLVCQDICIPENADLFLSLPVAASAKRGPNANLFSALPATGTNYIELLQAILFALLGGVILNLMPCVFPILSMKALGLIKKAHTKHRGHIVRGGLSYTAGVIVSFWLLAALLIAVKAAGHEIGWGIQLQSPAFVGILALVLFLIGLSLSDIIRIQAPMNAGAKLTHLTGHWGTFFTGALAVLVATPCTAPFMGAAMFYAFTQSWQITLAVFTALGLGLAAPYLCLTLCPPALKYLPKPGPWMIKLKKLLAWPMYAAALWLVWVFVQQIGIFPPHPLHANAVPYSAQHLKELRDAHKPVLVNMTASWCITCLVNERTALGTDGVQQFIKQNKITYMVGDWTNRDGEITNFLAQYDRIGVPLYVFFDACGNAMLLPQILTPAEVMKKLSPLPAKKSDCR